MRGLLITFLSFWSEKYHTNTRNRYDENQKFNFTCQFGISSYVTLITA